MNRYPEEIQKSVLTSERIRTRFPPEPNGYLHIGHIKALEASFHLRDLARKLKKKADCYLRFDDTNPTQEKISYIEAIQQDLEWLGYDPDQITYTSDYFDQLYHFAEQLIIQGDAYVCELTPALIKSYREEKIPSPFRDRSMKESLHLFRQMKAGETKGKTHCLRMKGDLTDPDPCMWDLVFYRVMETPHHRTKEEWCLYPTYDFAHCIVDSLEGITHSLCTTEFLSRRKSYFWLLDRLALPKPMVYEFGKLSVSQSILSKRQMKELVENETVTSWDDPRMMTVAGLRRRGYTPESLRRFVTESGISRVDATLEYAKLQQCLRTVLDYAAPRRMAVIDPIMVKIQVPELENVFTTWDASLAEYDQVTMYDYPMHMRDLSSGHAERVAQERQGTRHTRTTHLIFIERDSFRLKDEPGFYGLALNKTVRLRYSGFIKCTGWLIGEDGRISMIHAIPTIPENPKKVKGVLNWVNMYSPEAEFRFFEPLLDSDGYVNTETRKVCRGRIEADFGDQPQDYHQTFQFERQGYWKMDPESIHQDRLIFNQAVSQRSSYSG